MLQESSHDWFYDYHWILSPDFKTNKRRWWEKNLSLLSITFTLSEVPFQRIFLDFRIFDVQIQWCVIFESNLSQFYLSLAHVKVIFAQIYVFLGFYDFGMILSAITVTYIISCIEFEYFFRPYWFSSLFLLKNVAVLCFLTYCFKAINKPEFQPFSEKREREMAEENLVQDECETSDCGNNSKWLIDQV